MGKILIRVPGGGGVGEKIIKSVKAGVSLLGTTYYYSTNIIS